VPFNVLHNTHYKIGPVLPTVLQFIPPHLCLQLSDTSSTAHELIYDRSQLSLPSPRILAKQPGCDSFKNYLFTTFICFVSYQPAAGRGFDSRWCHWNFSVT
jgi:hypothetical protein